MIIILVIVLILMAGTFDTELLTGEPNNALFGKLGFVALIASIILLLTNGEKTTTNRTDM